jgi:hypothetical protein
LDGQWPGEDITTSMWNWMIAKDCNGEFREEIFLPQDYVEKTFPNNKDKVTLYRGTHVALDLSNGCKNDGNSLFMREDSHFTMTVYPNLQPFRAWEYFKIVTSSPNKEFSILITNNDGKTLFSHQNVVDNNNVLEWNLLSLSIGLEEINIQIKSLSNNAEITNLAFGFDITPDDVEVYGQRRTIPTTTIPVSAIVGTVNFELEHNLTLANINAVNPIFEQEDINEETIFIGNFPFKSLNIPLRPDFKNLAFTTEDNQRVKHYLLNKADMQGFYLGLPPNAIKTGDIKLKAIIYNMQTVVESYTSIFDYFCDTNQGRPSTNLSKLDYPNITQRQPTSQMINGESVITTQPYGSEGFRVGNTDYQEINYIVDYSGAMGDDNNGVTFFRDSKIEDQGVNPNMVGFKYNDASWGLWGGSRSIVSQKSDTMHMEALRSPNSSRAWYYHDKLNRPNYSLSTNAYTRLGEYVSFRSHQGSVMIAFVVSMQNPYQTSLNTVFSDKNYQYTPI